MRLGMSIYVMYVYVFKKSEDKIGELLFFFGLLLQVALFYAGYVEALTSDSH